MPVKECKINGVNGYKWGDRGKCEFYVYIHFNLITGEPFYVGKGKKNRHKSINGRNIYWLNYTKKYGYESLIIEENLEEKDAYELEIYWISQLKNWGFKLTNLTEGGEGLNYWKGKKRPDISKKFKGHKVTNETREKISNSNKGKRNSINTEFKKGFIPHHTGKSKYLLFKNNRPAEIRKCLCCNNDFIARIDKPTIYCSISCSKKIKNASTN